MALSQVQKDLAGSGLAIKVYDCYRPTRAVRTMAQWANDGRPAGATGTTRTARATVTAVTTDAAGGPNNGGGRAVSASSTGAACAPGAANAARAAVTGDQAA